MDLSISKGQVNDVTVLVNNTEVVVQKSNNITVEISPTTTNYVAIDRGIQGATGATGATGSAATIAVGSTSTLSAGSSATVSNVGTSSAAVFNFGIPQGAQGIQGIQGIQGATGATGATGAKGDTGATGATGAGVATGGTTGQVLAKSSNADYATNWITPSTGTVTSVVGTAPISSSGGTAPTISIAQATTNTNGYLTSADWNTFNNKQQSGSYLTGVTTDLPLSGSGTSAIHLTIAQANSTTSGYLTNTDWNTFNSKGNGTVTAVGATSPITSTGGTSPSIGILQATTTTNGYLSSTDWNTFNNKTSNTGTVTSISATGGTGISVTGSPITTNGTLNIINTAPDQTVAINSGTGISVAGTYPTFSVTNTAPDQVVSLTGTGATTVTGTYPNFTINSTGGSGGGGTVTSVGLSAPTGLSVSGSPVTTSGTLALSYASGYAIPTTAKQATWDTAIQTITSTDGTVTVTPTGTTTDLSVPVAASTTNVIAQVRNTTGATLTKGTVVYMSGATGQIPTVSKALATSDATSAQSLGVMSADLANNSNGYVTVIGLLTNMDTSAYTDGQQLYLSSTTAGALTATKQYAPAHLVYVAFVEHAHPTQGKLFIKVQNGYEMDELHNVSAQSPSNGNTLIWNASTNLWEAHGLTNGSGISVTNGAGSITVANTAPDQTVVMNNGTGISVTGTYPNFTVTNTAPDQVVSLTGTGSTTVTGTYPSFTINSTGGSGGGVLSVTGTSPIASSGGTTPAISISQATTSTDGYLSATDWNTFNSKGSGTVTTVTATSPVTSTGGTTPVIAIPAATTSVNGYLSATDWTTFNNKAAKGANTDITSVALTTGTITTAPASSSDIVNKSYADSIASGVNFHAACNYATTAALPTNTYSNGASGIGATLTAVTNGALTVDGSTPAVGNRILVKNEATQANNGVYTVTQVGTGVLPYILTRALDYDTSGSGTNEVDQGDLLLVISGTANANTSWVQQTPLPITIGTTSIVFIQFAAVQTYTAGTGLTLATNQFSITNTGTAGTYGSATQTPVFVTNAQGQVTSVTNTTITPAIGSVSGLGTGIATALAVNTGSTGAPVINGGALGTPSSGTVTNLTGTASININGTVGATTPTTGAFSTASANNFINGFTNIVSTGGTTTLTANSTYCQFVSGTLNHTIVLPNATTLNRGTAFLVDNDSTGVLSVNDNAAVLFDTIPSGGVNVILLEDNTTAAGVWSKYAWIPASINWGTSGVDFAGSTINNAPIGTITPSTGAFTKLSVSAGTATVAPINLTAGTNLTTATAGAIEYDGSTFYASKAASTRGVLATEQMVVLNTAYTLTSQTAAQKLFNATTNGAVTLPIGTYQFECAFSLTSMSGTSGSFGFAMVAGTAVIGSQGWNAVSQKVTALNGQNSASVATYNTAANTTLSATNTSTSGYAFIRGIIKITTAGTLIPSVSLGVAAAAVVGINSYFKISPITGASAANITVGNWS